MQKSLSVSVSLCSQSFLSKNPEGGFIHSWEDSAIGDAHKLWWMVWDDGVVTRVRSRERILCRAEEDIHYQQIPQLQCLELIWLLLLVLCWLQFVLHLPGACSIPLTSLLQNAPTKKKQNPEPEQIKQNPEIFFQQKKNPNCKDFLWSQTARILLWSQTQTARISCGHRHECMSLEP